MLLFLCAPVVKWISQLTSDQLFWVRVLAGALEVRGKDVLLFPIRGYGLVVKRVLAKDQSGVRFSLAAPKGPVEKGVSSGDKRQKTLKVNRDESLICAVNTGY